MKNAKLYRDWLRGLRRERVICAASLLMVALLVAGYGRQLHGEGGNSFAPMSSPLLTSESDHSLPSLLTDRDASLYKEIFAAQKKSDWQAADRALKKVSAKLLLGHVLAQRYLSLHYHASEAQLADWLSRYGDQPQAADIHALALARAPQGKNALPPLHRQAMLGGYGDDTGLARRGDEMYVRTWRAGLEAWRDGDKIKAAKLFSTVADQGDKLSPWTAAAAAYWSWRAYDAIGNRGEAARYLQQAAGRPRSFYGILARRQLRQSLDLDTEASTLSDRDVLALLSDTAVRRAIALAQAGQSELAEREMRALFPQADARGKWQLLALAHELGLASVQIGMARQLERDGHPLDYAKYPVPRWQPQDGFTVDPALIFAFMRQESGFHASAVSPGGALGLMQLMPKTAQSMQRATDTSGNATDPELNLTLGQSYVQHLLDNPLVDGNLVYLLAAYNAGPGRLQEWKRTLHAEDDPLLFVESIPCPETRYYVMQVMANYWIYSAIAGTTGHSAYALLHGRWPSYDAYVPPVASRATSNHAG
ncbi:MAG: lytic transglycosylase domain-containing protein [Pseudomonadota bacterium]|nr:lytic transglycosylase domain-containing protein [Pseudomonadota bacterium]